MTPATRNSRHALRSRLGNDAGPFCRVRIVAGRLETCTTAARPDVIPRCRFVCWSLFCQVTSCPTLSSMKCLVYGLPRAVWTMVCQGLYGLWSAKNCMLRSDKDCMVYSLPRTVGYGLRKATCLVYLEVFQAWLTHCLFINNNCLQ